MIRPKNWYDELSLRDRQKEDTGRVLAPDRSALSLALSLLLLSKYEAGGLSAVSTSAYIVNSSKPRRFFLMLTPLLRLS